jgi:hypothetical protein
MRMSGVRFSPSPLRACTNEAGLPGVDRPGSRVGGKFLSTQRIRRSWEAGAGTCSAGHPPVEAAPLLGVTGFDFGCRDRGSGPRNAAMISLTTRCKRKRRRQRARRPRSRCLSENGFLSAPGVFPTWVLASTRGLTPAAGCGLLGDITQRLGLSYRRARATGGAE